MKPPPLSCSRLAPLLLLVSALTSSVPRAPAQTTIDFVGLEKFSTGTQTNTSTIAPTGYVAEVHIEGQNLQNYVGQVTLPGSGTVNTLADLASTASSHYSSASLLNADYPNGDYTIAVGPDTSSLSTVVLRLGTAGSLADLYPTATPRLTNGTWNNLGQLVIDPSSAYTFSFNTGPSSTYRPEYNNATIGAALTFTIRDSFGQEVAQLSANQVVGLFSDTLPQSFNLLSGVLHPGQSYTGMLEFSLLTEVKTAADAQTSLLGTYGGEGLAAAVFGKQTYFTIVTVPEPSVTAALAGLLALGAALHLRRRRPAA